MFRTNALKVKLKAGHAAFGVINATGAPVVAEMLGLAGYDFVLVDGEHGPSGPDSHLAQLMALQATPATALYRAREFSQGQVKRALDLGFEGLLIPSIGGADAAAEAVAACRYPPRGTRGMAARLARASDYGLRADAYLAQAEAELFICVMIETGRAVEQIAAIAAIEGVDAVLIGPHDLAGDLGCRADLADPRFAAAVRRIEAAVTAAGKALGGIALPELALPEMLQRGYRFITCGSDVGFLRTQILQNLEQVGLPRPGG